MTTDTKEVALTPIARIESLKLELTAVEEEAQEIAQAALDDGRELTEEDVQRLDFLVGASRNGTDEGCRQAELMGKVEHWTSIQAGIDNRRKLRQQIDVPPGNDDVKAAFPALRRTFPMGCNRPVIVPQTAAMHRRDLESWWGDTRPEREENAYAAGQWILAHVFAYHPEACESPAVPAAVQWCKDHGIFSQQQIGDPGKGGNLVPTPLERTIWEVRQMYGVMARYARQYPMDSATLAIPRFATGLAVGLVAELAAQALTEKAWTQPTLTAKKAGGYAQWSTEVAEDAVIALAADLSRDFGIAHAFREDFTGFVGDGVSDFANMGITGLTGGLHANAAVTLGAGKITAGDIELGDFESLMGLISDVTVTPRWYCTKATYYGAMHPIKTAAGGNTIGTLTDGDPMTSGGDFRFLGYEGNFTQVLPDVAANAVGPVVFGDLSRCVAMGVRRGVTVRIDNSIKVIEDAVVMTCNERYDQLVVETGENADQRTCAQFICPAA